MAAMYVFILSLYLLQATNGQVPSSGGCPKVTTIKEFDLQQYLGHWYEQKKFYAAFEVDQTCANANYSLKANGHIEVVNTGFDKNGKVVEAVGDAYVADEKDPGKLKLRFSNFAPYGNYWILDTDYKTYTLIYACTNILNLTHLELAWILTREPTVDQASMDKWLQVFSNFGIDTSKFQTTDQSQCPSHIV